MCPDKQFLSIYFDSELPSPWKERMERHIENCPQCGKLLELYKKTSSFLKDDAENAMEAAKSRVFEKAAPGWRAYSLYQSRLLRIPKRVAAAAIAAAALIFVMLFITPSKISENEIPELSGAVENADGIVVSSDYELAIPEITSTLDMSEVLRYLENDGSSNIVIIKLPERKKFARYGEPAFINAADYRRRPIN
ncbi:MAG: hypothetical protein LBH18_07045 [Spirochaetaceae bacterium]|jgi:hypothetical protein|nr:hypothetical protein [Spirochaetaceae bacterium]